MSALHLCCESDRETNGCQTKQDKTLGIEQNPETESLATQLAVWALSLQVTIQWIIYYRIFKNMVIQN